MAIGVYIIVWEAAVAQCFGCQPVIHRTPVWSPDGAVYCCFLEQGTSLSLLQPTQLYNGYLIAREVHSWTHMKTYFKVDVGIQGKINNLTLPFMMSIIGYFGAFIRFTSWYYHTQLQNCEFNQWLPCTWHG